MSSSLDAIADGVVTKLNAAPLGATAERVYLPMEDLTALDTLHLLVTIADDEISVLSRDDALEEITIHVGVLKHLPAGTVANRATGNAVIDPLVALCRQIALLYEPGDVSADAIWLKTSYSPVCDRDRLKTLRVFFGVIAITFRQAS